MRLIVLVLAALATGCLETPVETSTASSDLTFSYYSPRLAVVARIAGQRRTADDLRAAVATKPPLYSTWTVLQEYRTLVQFNYDCAETLEESADALEMQLGMTSDVTALDQSSQILQLQLQMSMQRRAELMNLVSNIMKAMHETTSNVIDNLKD
jgi:hypothetical protein